MKRKLTMIAVTVCALAWAPAFAHPITVALASDSQIKNEAVLESFQDRFPEAEIALFTCKTDSDVPEQPVGHETALRGAKNRLNALPAEIAGAVHYAVAIENYIEQSPTDGSWHDVGLIFVQDHTQQETKEHIALTQETPIPSSFVQLAKEMSTNSQVSEDGFSVTVGKAIKCALAPRKIDAQDWQKEAEFGGVSRQKLIKEALFKTLHADELAFLKSKIGIYPDFPKPGIIFEDFCPILSDPEAFRLCIDLLYEHYKTKRIEAVIGLESRGFILGAALAYKLGVGFIAVRKPGKLPGPTYSVSYEKEYGVDTLAIQQSALAPNQRILIIDDLIATGGTAKAAAELVSLAGGITVEFASILEVKGLGGRQKLGLPTFNLID